MEKDALLKGTDFSVNNVSESDGWHKYEYVISNAVFEKEGQYNIVVETKDKADSVAYSDVKSVNIEFIVDKTAPTYTLTGVDKNNENYIGSKNAVLMPKDDGGKLGRVKITVVGKDDKEKKVINALKDTGVLDKLAIMKPYSFVLVDEDRETVTELLLIDEEDTLLLNDELLKGLDEELDAFLKDLLEK